MSSPSSDHPHSSPPRRQPSSPLARTREATKQCSTGLRASTACTCARSRGARTRSTPVVAVVTPSILPYAARGAAPERRDHDRSSGLRSAGGGSRTRRVAPMSGRTGLGPIEVALLDALESGKVGGAALDVIEGEEGVFYADRRGKPIENAALLRLQHLPNVLISPHTAYYTDHALRDTIENSLVNCLTFESEYQHA